MKFEKVFRESEIILTEGAIAERLKSENDVKPDEFINHAGLIYDNPEILEELYRQYLNIGMKYNLPMMIMTPTRRVNFESVDESNYKDNDIIKDSAIFLKRIKDSYEDYSQNILIGGLLGCKGDAYSGDSILSTNEAFEFHREQTNHFKNSNIDFLFAGIMPEINEATGMAMAMAETEIPYIISFMIRKDGRLMDGTLICDAIEIIDYAVSKKPLCYMTNCIHPTNLIEALDQKENKTSKYLNRFQGIQSNASVLSPEELNNCSILLQEDFTTLVDEMCVLRNDSNLKIFGGCCGTDDRFLDLLASRLVTKSRLL